MGSLNAATEEMRRHVSAFVDQKLRPIAADLETSLSPSVVTEMARQGFLAAKMPEEFGGSDIGPGAYAMLQEELSRCHTVLSLLCDLTSGLAPTLVLRYGSQLQKETILPPLADGSALMAFALSEPGAGSDARAISTRAEKTASGWRINGVKHYISGGAEAANLVVIAKHRNGEALSAFLVPAEAPGFSVSRSEKTISDIPISLAELRFDNCEVADEALLGEPGQGLKYASETLHEGRINVAMSCIGVASRVIELSCKHAKVRSTFGAPLAERQAVQWMLADAVTELEASRALTYPLLQDLEAGQSIPLARSSMAKLYASEMVGRVTDAAVQIHGGFGVVRGSEVERFFREVRHYRIGEGASEIHRMIIARSLLKEVD